MTRRTLASMLLLALLLVQGSVTLCGIRCLLPAGAPGMTSASCHGMVIPDAGDAAHTAAPCERHICPVVALDAYLEDHHNYDQGDDHGSLNSVSLTATVWPDGVQLLPPSFAGPVRRRLDLSPPPAAYHPLTDSLRV